MTYEPQTTIKASTDLIEAARVYASDPEFSLFAEFFATAIHQAAQQMDENAKPRTRQEYVALAGQVLNRICQSFNLEPVRKELLETLPLPTCD